MPRAHCAVDVAVLRQAVRAAVRAAHVLDLTGTALVRSERALVHGAVRRDDGPEEGLCRGMVYEQEEEEEERAARGQPARHHLARRVEGGVRARDSLVGNAIVYCASIDV